jgi:hypothetical protein
MRGWLFVIALAASTVACGGGGGAPEPDAFFSYCGHPGDEGNELGVGKFCDEFADCGDTVNAPLCSEIGDPSTHFCTKTCRGGDADAGSLEEQCGSGEITCVCSGGQCGCTPTECL